MVGITGVSYKSLRGQIEDTQSRLHDRPTVFDTRSLISDKLEPVHLELRHIRKQLNDQKSDHRELDGKVDTIIELLHKKWQKEQGIRSG